MNKKIISTFVLCISMVIWTTNVRAQLNLSSNFNPTIGKYSFISTSQGLQLGYTSGPQLRHSTFMYNPIKITGLNVISVHQPGSPFDNIYYVDDTGSTQYRSMDITGPMNFHGATGHTNYDSFNPYGSENIYEGIVDGLANLFLSKMFSKKK